jgi:FkbM family methyltransferase
MNYKFMIKDFFVCKGNLKKWFWRRVASINTDNYMAIPKEHIKYLGTDSALFYVKYFFLSIFEQVETEYDYSDLRPTDIVLDIGANFGAFSLKIYQQVKHIYAVEPLFVEELTQNISLNNAACDITILPHALSTGADIKCAFNGKEDWVQSRTLTQLIKQAGGHVDFLKCDCEGGEWAILPHEIKGIRRIEMEVHSFHGEKLDDMVTMLQTEGFKTITEPRDGHTMMIHARR